MYKSYKVVANTAVGRRRYLKYLLPQVLASKTVDRYDLWVNTIDKVDIAFFQAMAEEFPKLNLIWQPKGEINGIFSMADFYPFCQEENTIYIKLDDDVVWFASNFFEEICRFRVENPDYFLVSPMVINNGICTYILQSRGLLKTNEYLRCQGYDLAVYNGVLAEQLHEWFITNYLKTNRYNELYCGENIIAMQRFAINAVAWFGDAFKQFGGKVVGDDEEFLTIKYPVTKNLVNCFDCNTIVSHFSFSAQREYLDKTDILLEYEKYIAESSDERLRKIYDRTSQILNIVNSRSSEICTAPLPHDYKSGAKPKSNRIIKKYIQDIIGQCLRIPKAHQYILFRLIVDVARPNRKYIG